MKPLCIDLFAGLGGWDEGFLAEGYDVTGYDIKQHDYGTGTYPGKLVLKDVRTIWGGELANAICIVASPPCTEYSYMAMPWSRGKQIARALRGQDEFPEDYTGSRTIADLNQLFNDCFRIQREASWAAGRHIPMIVENVRGAIPWVGRSAWNFGSFHLWGDVPALMPISKRGTKFNPDGTAHPPGSWSAIADSNNRGFKSSGVKLTDNNSECRWEDRPVKRLKDAIGCKNSRNWWSYGAGNLSATKGSKSRARKAASAEIAKIPLPLAQHIARCFANQHMEATR